MRVIIYYFTHSCSPAVGRRKGEPSGTAGTKYCPSIAALWFWLAGGRAGRPLMAGLLPMGRQAGQLCCYPCVSENEMQELQSVFFLKLEKCYTVTLHSIYHICTGLSCLIRAFKVHLHDRNLCLMPKH